MKRVFVLYYPLRPLLQIATVIHSILKYNGIENTLTNNYNIHHDTEDDLYLIIWNGISIYPKNCIIFNFDPMSAPHVYRQFTSQLENSPNTKIKLLVDYCSGLNSNIFNTIMLVNPHKFPDTNYKLIPFGYSRYYEELHTKWVPVNPDKKDIDVLFYGGNNDRRSMVINHVLQLCNAKGKKFVFRNQDLHISSERADLVSRSKIVLSIASQDALNSATNDLARLSYLISNKIFVIAERIGDKVVEDVLSEYINYSYNIDEFLQRINYFLEDSPKINEEIKNSVNIAYDRFRVDFNYDQQFYTNVLPVVIDHVYKDVVREGQKLLDKFDIN